MGPDALAHMRVDVLPAIVACARPPSVPTAIHLNHGARIAQILLATHAGFASVVIDGSAVLLQQDVALTKRAVDAAHAVRMSVEGKLGAICTPDSEGRYGCATILYPDPDEAARFIEATGVVLLPLALPGLVTTALVGFIAAWNGSMSALTFTRDSSTQTVGPVIANSPLLFFIAWCDRAASAAVTARLVAMVMLRQRRLIAGLAAGAVKG